MEAPANIVGSCHECPWRNPEKPVLESAPAVLIGRSQLCLPETEGWSVHTLSARWRESCSTGAVDLTLLWERNSEMTEDKHLSLVWGIPVLLELERVYIIDTNLTISRGITDSLSHPGGMCVCDWMWKERESGRLWSSTSDLITMWESWGLQMWVFSVSEHVGPIAFPSKH